MIKYVLYISAILMLLSCRDTEEKIPADILDANTFTAVMIDVQLSEGMNSQKSYTRIDKEQIKNVDPYQEVFEKLDIDPEAFQRTYDYYSKRPAKMELIYEQVLDSLTKLDVEVKQRYTKEERSKNDSIRVASQQRSDSIRGILRLK